MAPETWKVLSGIADNLTVVTLLVLVAYGLISDKVHTRGHTNDVVAGKDELIESLRGERDRATEREDAARRELAENNVVLNRLDTTMREALQSLARRR